MGEFNSDDHYIYYHGQESLRRNGVAFIVNKSPKHSTWIQSQKRQNALCLFPRQTISVYIYINDMYIFFSFLEATMILQQKIFKVA